MTALGDVADTLDRVTPVRTVPPSCRADYVGTYASPEVVTPYRVLTRDSTLVLRRSHGDDVPLSPTARDAFDAEGLASVRLARDRSGRIIAMSVTTRGVHALQLQRRGSAAKPST